MQEFGPKGVLLSDVHYSDWEPFAGDQEQPSAAASGIAAFPRVLQIEKPHDDYRMELQVTKLMVNEDIPDDRFKLEQPASSELIHVGEDAPEKKP